MTLKFQVENLEGIDEAAQALYKQQDSGGYVLDVEGAVSQSKFNEVNQRAVDNGDEASRRRKTLERVTGKLGLETAEGLDDALDALLTGAKSKGKDDTDQKAIVDQIKSAAEAEKAELQSQLNSIRTEGAKSQLQAALMTAGFGDKVAEMIAGSSMGRVSFDEAGQMRILQTNGTPLAGSGAGGLATLGDLSTELAAAMPELLTDKGKGGGGKPPASNGNGGGSTATRAEVDAMSQASRSSFFSNGGKIA